MSKPYAFILDAYTRPEQSEAFAELFAGYIAGSRAEHGCVEYHMLRDPLEPTRFSFYEVWQDRAAFDRHVALPHMREFHEQRMNYLRCELQVRMIEPVAPLPSNP
ncbi:putative quinol monooxygenase [Pseudomonas sp. EL_65y_Pfl2_R95]|uniref:putative quinol monooxygenase n=1 Tax=Pseudomonas sp. EL_65y_Pfl2_R95 TaxID=3088698 RepID=UPI0030D99865